MFKITINNKEVEKTLSLVFDKLKDFSKPFKTAGEELTKEFFGKKVFDSQGSAIGQKWKGHAATTAVSRARRWGHYSRSPVSTNKILVWTGVLKGGFTYKATSKLLRITNNVFYFKYNQPKRKMLDINNEVEKIVKKNFDHYLKLD